MQTIKIITVLIATIAVLSLGTIPVIRAETTGKLKAETPRFPDSAIGRIGERFVETVNSGDAATIRAFVMECVAESALQQSPVEEQAAWFQKLYAQSGGLDVVEISHAETTFLALNVRSRRGNHHARIYMRVSAPDARRVEGYGTLALPAPEEMKAERWPTEKLSEKQIRDTIARNVGLRVKQDRFSGVVLVAKGEKIFLQRAYGLADRNYQIPNRLDTKFHLGSMNKMFTALVIGQLVEAGKLSFEDTLAKVLPEYPNREAAEKITIRHLLTHAAGLGSLFDRPAFDRRKRYRTHADYLPIFAKEPLRFAPGTRNEYSNEGFVVLGAVIEKVTGQSYFEVIRQRIYAPAGMHDTDSYALNEVVPHLAVGYMRSDEDDPLGIEPRRPNHHFLGMQGNACGGGYATAPDLLKFAQALRSYRLLSRDMTEKITGKAGERNYGYGFEALTVNGKDIRGHSGGGPSSGINSDLKIFWDGSWTVIVMGNYDAPAAQDLNARICEFLTHQE